MQTSAIKKTLLLALMLITGSVWAEWTPVVAADDKLETHYFDLATIKKEGNYRKVWEIVDYKNKQKDGTQSLRARVEYDCEERRNRVLSISGHSESMAKGNVRGLETEAGPWTEIPPGTSGFAKMLFACAK